MVNITKLNEWASIDKCLSVVKTRITMVIRVTNEKDDVSIVFFNLKLFDEFESF